MIQKIKILLEMIQFKLTVFALPFAFTGGFLAARGVPTIKTIMLVILAMVGARTCAMGFNRIADRHFDGKNPRTSERAIPAGEVKLWEAWLMVLISGGIFFRMLCVKLPDSAAVPTRTQLNIVLFSDKTLYCSLPSCAGPGSGIFSFGWLGCCFRQSGWLSLGIISGGSFLGRRV